MKLIILIVIIGGVWFAHSKLGIKWSSIFLGLGAAGVAIVAWANKTNRDTRQQGHDRVNQFSGYDNYKLKNFINDFSNDPMERQTASRILRSRQEKGTDRY
ncbi:hypothetical protein [Lactiplantibacillus paraplantarum]|uniref:hypothetical protein n=1 Tax=Lactiplantibacillus paraplantarum TaxID=60520 RepID=UPI0023AAC4E5|nr:hypothetical protein [Lactiplantibacillus paraplantarum]WEE36052.1 hypothetical protein PWO93_00225 [Lactiplantibacillus paraplantarum]